MPTKPSCAPKSNRGYFVASDWLNPFQDAYVAELIDWVDSLQGKFFPRRDSLGWLCHHDGDSGRIQSLNTAAVVPVKLIENRRCMPDRCLR